MNQLQAARDTIELARSYGMHEFPYLAELGDEIQWHHLEDMLRRMEGMSDKSEAKIGRWLGWMQCAVFVMCADVTLEDLKQINIKNSADPESEEKVEEKVEWEYHTSAHSGRGHDAMHAYMQYTGWEVDESHVKDGIIEFDTHVERHWKRKKQNV
ncbi:hypothetical protein P10VF_008 [Rhizobium phage vB_RleM_P10VF]|uniref:Uncharacterized protein n=1 Tax=Rhizobium phage vB_RleM_P10VF TaxID=1527770 RepID=A0A076YPU2_9CAUD|nr:hypothetical protein P10VF_008 [Rhizobium phage vB_RleM_P10VF]AIK68221.1 hypothetical protein P10VF_008 [Rhizobium phage vB_RleM_P10VF]